MGDHDGTEREAQDQQSQWLQTIEMAQAIASVES